MKLSIGARVCIETEHKLLLIGRLKSAVNQTLARARATKPQLGPHRCHTYHWAYLFIVWRTRLHRLEVQAKYFINIINKLRPGIRSIRLVWCGVVPMSIDRKFMER